MEVEAKFVAPDEATLSRLEAAPALGGYELGRVARRQDRDTFFDTASRRLLAAGCYLRRRSGDRGTRFTLKRLVAVEGGVHRREESEAAVATGAGPDALPPGQLRDDLEALRAGEPLAPLLSLEQERATRVVRDGAREVAELSLDRVTSGTGVSARVWFEVEAEVRGEGTDADLAALTAVLAGEWGLAAESRSKFARALVLSQ